MAIEERQIETFSNNPIPDILNTSCTAPVSTLRGKESIVAKVGDPEEPFALKWYAKFSGNSSNTLVEYARGIDRDENRLIGEGLTSNQLPNSNFVIAPYNGRAELFAIQPWKEGRLLKDVNIFELLTNRPLRESLIHLYTSCANAYRKYGQFPDLIGGETIRVVGVEVDDPRKFMWPLRTTNIKVWNNTAVLIDARFLNFAPGSFKYGIARLHHNLTKFFTAFLRQIK